jgi:UDP-N-acetylglucosamine 4,6-dehydratase
VIPVFREQIRTGRITITDPRMTRFWITLEQGVRFVISCIEQMYGGEIFIPKLPSMNIMDLAKVMAPDAQIDYMGIRPGEKLHESMISADESRQAVDLGDRYAILPAHPWWSKENWAKGTTLPDDFSYSSDTNTHWLKPEELREMIDNA